jgi:hypothetical protein
MQFTGNVKLTASKGYIEVVRSDAVEGGTEFSAENTNALVAAAVTHATKLGVLIKAWAPDFEADKVLTASNGHTQIALFSAARIKAMQEAAAPVVAKARYRPLPYLAFLNKTRNKAQGLGDTAAVKAKAKKPAAPQGL